jgi:hypothetical protein
MHEVARHYWAGSYWFDIDDRPGLRCAETLVECGLRVVAEVAYRARPPHGRCAGWSRGVREVVSVGACYLEGRRRRCWGII